MLQHLAIVPSYLRRYPAHSLSEYPAVLPPSDGLCDDLYTDKTRVFDLNRGMKLFLQHVSLI